MPTHSKSVDRPELLEFRGDILTLSAGAPLPPGSRVAFTLERMDLEIPVTGKIVSSTPLLEGRFKLVIRTSSLSREHRAALRGGR